MKKDKIKEKLIEKGVSKDWLEKNFVHITYEEDDEYTGDKHEILVYYGQKPTRVFASKDYSDDEAYDKFIEIRSENIKENDVVLLKNDEEIDYYDSEQDRVDKSHKLTHKGKKYLIEWDEERNGVPMKYTTFITEDKFDGKLVGRNTDRKLFDEIYDKLLLLR